ncbi:MAG: HAD-IIIA family hydrolase [Defluviicoccus sp.]
MASGPFLGDATAAAVPLDTEGAWAEVLRPARSQAPQPALFLDRDGTIIEEVGFIGRAEDVRLIAGAAEVIAAANRRGIAVVIVTNQSGIARSLFDWADFAAVQARMLAELADAGAFIDAVLACPHHRDGRAPYNHPDHPDRKPNPGLVRRAAGLLPIALAQSWLVGDRASDIIAAARGGLAGGLLVATGVGAEPSEREAALQQRSVGRFEVILGGSIATALARLPLFGGGNLGEVVPPSV